MYIVYLIVSLTGLCGLLAKPGLNLSQWMDYQLHSLVAPPCARAPTVANQKGALCTLFYTSENLSLKTSQKVYAPGLFCDAIALLSSLKNGIKRRVSY